MAISSIEWTQMTWNPTTGCTKISAGCKHCYAEVLSRRLMAMGQEKYKNNFKLTIHPKTLLIPFTWTKPKIVFVNSMSDLFHDKVPLSYIKQVFEVMNKCPQHQFQVLTKRAERLEQISHELKWTKNIWMGVSVEDERVIHRIDHLRNTGAIIKFLSIEPLIGSVGEINLQGIDWVIVGGESGFKSREIKEEWVLDIKRQCRINRVAFFFKQWGGKNKKASGRLLNGRTYDEFPAKIKRILGNYQK